MPRHLVIARKGHEIRRIEGGPFVWKWAFEHDGKWVAYEAGPLHFSLACYLVDLHSGRQLAVYECYTNDLNAVSKPAWVKQLETNGHPWTPATCP